MAMRVNQKSKFFWMPRFFVAQRRKIWALTARRGGAQSSRYDSQPKFIAAKIHRHLRGARCGPIGRRGIARARQFMTTEVKHLTLAELEAGMTAILQSPKDQGVLELIVRRPQVEAREVLVEGELDLAAGLVGDSWKSRGSSSTPDGSANPEMQLNIMNSRVVALLAQTKDRWPLAGDQLYVDLDLSAANVPPGTQLSIGSAIIEVTSPHHTGCKKFMARYGEDAMKFVNSPTGRQLHLRGINAKVVQPGAVRVGDVVKKI
jgi:hypothetical protein